MNPLKRDNNSVRATDHENRIQTLERRLAMDYPVFCSTSGNGTPISVLAGTTETILFNDPGDIQDTAAGEFETDPTGEWFMLPPAWEGAFKVYGMIAWQGGSVPTDVTEPFVFEFLEVLENIGGTWTPLGGGLNCHAYYQRTQSFFAGDPRWQTMYLHAQNNTVGGNPDRRYGISHRFANFSPVNITVAGGTLVVELAEEDTSLACMGF